MSKDLPQAGGINTLSKLRTYTAPAKGDKKTEEEDERVLIRRGDAWSVDPLIILEEEEFNARGAFATDYWNRPNVKARIRGFADSYKAGRYVPAMVVIVRNGDIILRQGAHRWRGLHLAISEGAPIKLVNVIEQKGDEAAQAVLVVTDNDSLHLTPLEKAVQYGKLQAYGWSVSAIAKEVSMTPEHVRTALQLLELPIEMKRMIADEIIAATFAFNLYNQHGTKAVDYVNQALASKEIIQEEPRNELELALTILTEGLALPDSKEEIGQNELGGTDDSKTSAPDPEPKTRKPKITGKDVAKLVGTTPKIAKKTIQFVHKSFETLSQRIDQITLQGDHFVMELNAEEFALLKEMRAQLSSVKKPEPVQKDQAQADLLEGQKEAANSTGQTLQ